MNTQDKRIGGGAKKKGWRKPRPIVAPTEQVHDRVAAELPPNAHVRVIEVDDPYGEPGARINVAQSLKTDPLAWMKAHNRIDEPCYLAGRRWQAIYARANIGNIKAIDPTKETVDGGRFPEAITDGHIKAFKGLREAEKTLEKQELIRLVYDILARELFPREVAQEHGEYSHYAPRKWARKFYRALNKLAVHFGYSTPKPTQSSRKPTQNY